MFEERLARQGAELGQAGNSATRSFSNTGDKQLQGLIIGFSTLPEARWLREKNRKLMSLKLPQKIPAFQEKKVLKGARGRNPNWSG